ncbi:hypothetical protein ACOMHN_030256 [Nucella lapillus]
MIVSEQAFKHQEDEDDGQQRSSVDSKVQSTPPPPPPPPTSPSGPVTPDYPQPNTDSAGSLEGSREATESRLRSEFMKVFTGRTPQAGLNGRADLDTEHSRVHCETEHNTSVDGPRSLITDGAGGSCGDDCNTDGSIFGSSRSADLTESRSDFSSSMKRNGPKLERELQSEAQTSTNSAGPGEANGDNVNESNNSRKPELQGKMPQWLVDSQETKTCIPDVQSAIVCLATSPNSLADRIDRAQLCCSAMRSDISQLSARCDVLLLQLKTTRTHLASWGGKRLTADRGMTVSVDVKHTSWVKPLPSVPAAALFYSSAALQVKPESKCGGAISTPIPRTSLSIVQHLEQELSFRLDQLTAFVSSSETSVGQTKADSEADKHSHFAEASPSFSCEPAVNSLHPSTGKDMDRERGGDVFIKYTSVMLTPPMSDQSACLNEDDSDRQQRSDSHILNPSMTSWTGPADVSPPSPEPQYPWFGSDCGTPEIEALTCLESFSDSGRLKLPLPLADPQFLQSSVMMHTPPPSDLSAESQNSCTDIPCSDPASQGHNSCTDVSHSVPTSQATQPDRSVPGQQRGCYDSEGSLSSSECSEADWKGYYDTQSYWSCSSHLTDGQTSDGPAEGQVDDSSMKKSPIGTVGQREGRHPDSGGNTSTIYVASSVAKTDLDVAVENKTQSPVHEPTLEVDTRSAVQQANVHILSGPQTGLQHLELNGNRCTNKSDNCLELQEQSEQLKPSMKSSDKSSPESNLQGENDDKMNLVCTHSSGALNGRSEDDASKVLKSVPSRSTSPHRTIYTICENRGLKRMCPTVDRQAEAGSCRETTEILYQLSHESFIPGPTGLPESHPDISNMDENHVATKGKNSATEKKSKDGTRACAQIADSKSSSERATVSTDESHDEFLRISAGPAKPQKQLSQGINEVFTSTSITHNTQQQGLAIILEELNPVGKWKLHQKRDRHHRSARHLQHLSMTQSGCWSVSQEAESLNQNSDDIRTVGQSYNTIEGVSCGFNFLRQSSSQIYLPWMDVNNNIPLPVNVVLPHRNHSQTACKETEAASGLRNFQADNLNAHGNRAFAKTCSVTDGTVSKQSEAHIPSHQIQAFGFASDYETSPAQQKKRLVTMEELKARIYLVTEMQSTEFGVCVKHCSLGIENGATDSSECFTDTVNVWDKEPNCSRTEVTLSTYTKAQEEVAASCTDKNSAQQNKKLSDATYFMKDTQQQHMLSCIVEAENERTHEEDLGSLQSRPGDVPQGTEPAEEQAEKSSRGSDTVQSGASRVRREDSSPNNRHMSKVQESAVETAAAEKRTLDQEGSPNLPECKPVSDIQTDVQENFANVSFDNPSVVLNTSAPAFNSKICRILTSTPVLANQKITWQQGGCIMRGFFDPNQSTEHSCILDMTENVPFAAHSSQIQPNLSNGLRTRNDNEVKRKGMVGCLRSVNHNFNSLGHMRKMPDLPEEANSVSAKSRSKVFVDSDNRLACPDVQSVSNAAECLSAGKGIVGPKHPHPQVTQPSRAVNFADTFVIARQAQNKVDSTNVEASCLEKVSCVRNRLTVGDQSVTSFMASAIGTESSSSKLQSDGEIVPGTRSSETRERTESHPNLYNECEEKVDLGTKLAGNTDSVTKPNNVTKPSGNADNVTTPSGKADNVTKPSGNADNVTKPSGNADNVTKPAGNADNVTKPSGNADNVTDLLMKPRPKPLLPTPPYRRSALSGSDPPCPHCLNHGLPPFPAGQPPAWSHCPQDCGCGHSHREHGQHTPFSPMFQAKWTSPAELCGPWIRAYNGPTTTCVHHRGISQVLLPPQSAAVPCDNSKRTVNHPKQACPRRHCSTKNTACSSAKPPLQHKCSSAKPPLQHKASASQETVLQQGTSDNIAQHQHPPVSSAGGARAQSQVSETEVEVKEDVLSLFLLTWTLLLSSLNIVVHGKDTHCRAVTRH